MVQRPVAPTAPELVLETDTGSTVMSPGREYHVGRDPLSDIVIDDARVSWHHAVLRAEDGHWTLEDEHSTNGTYADGRRIEAGDVGPGCEIRFGNASDGPRALLVGPAAPAPERPSAVSMPNRTGTFRQAHHRTAAAQPHRPHRPRRRQRPGHRRPGRLPLGTPNCVPSRTAATRSPTSAATTAPSSTACP